jgi:hypothetical protein
MLKTENIEKKLDFLANNVVISLIIIAAIGLAIRFYYFPYNIPLTLDSLNAYFFYANDISILGHLPSNYSFNNNGWPLFLSFFFSVFHSNNFLDYMTLQRTISVILSVLTIIPVYLLCNKFIGRSYSLVGAAIFAFEPRIIQNSVLGITEPLYFILLTISLVLFFSPNPKIKYISFAVAALTSLVRAEGLFLFLALSVLYFITEKKDIKIIGRYVIALVIFLLVLLPMAYLRIQTMGTDGLTDNFTAGAHNTLFFSSQKGGGVSGLILYVIGGLENYFKYLAWVMIPIFIFFVPIGIFLMKNRNRDLLIILITLFILSLPSLYAYAMGIQETRYLYTLYPLFCVISLFTIKPFAEKFKSHNTILILIIAGILLSSLVFLDIKKTDYEHQREAFGIAHYVVTTANGINDYYPEDSYIRPAQLPEKWPMLESSVAFQTTIIPTTGFNSLEKYIEFAKQKGLTDIVVDGNRNRPAFLNDIFYQDEKYPYLTKIFDSWDHGYKYHVKIYKINYDIFNSLINEAIQ